MRRRSTCNRLPSRRLPLPSRATIPSYIATALVSPRAALPASAAIARMADDMRLAAAHGTGITADDLTRLGFTPAQVKLHADDARTLAQSLSGASL
jgi:hypothetical protein